MKKFDKHIAEQYLNKLIKQHKIKVVAYSKSSCGRAWYKKWEIKIPAPTNVDRFVVALHEVGHLVNYQCYGRKAVYMEEYETTMYSLQHCLKAGFSFASVLQRQRNYVMMKLAMAHNRGLDWGRVPQCVIDFVFAGHGDYGDDMPAKWKGKKVFVDLYGKLLHQPADIILQQMEKSFF